MKYNERVLKVEMVLQGIGALICWNAILTALDWYNNRFPDKNPSFWLPLLNFMPSPIFQPLTIIYGHNFTFNVRIISSYLIIASILILTPIIVEFSSNDVGFVLVCILTVIMGSVNAIGQTSVFGLAGTLPNEYTGAVMLGNGLSGLSIACLRLLCLAIFKQNSDGYLHSTELYFAASGATLIVCILVQLHLMKHLLVIECLSRTHSKEARLMSPTSRELGSAISNGFSPLTDEISVKPKVNYRILLKKIWQYLFLVWLNYLITFGVLSHVALATEDT